MSAYGNMAAIDKALEWFDGGKHWIKASFWSGKMDERDGRRLPAHGCMVGGLILSEFQQENSEYACVESLPCTVSIRNAIIDLFGDRVTNPFVAREEDDFLDVIYAFNDDDNTTFDDVQLVFKHAREAEYEKWVQETEEAIKQGEML